MLIKSYYIECSARLKEVLRTIENLFPCWIHEEPVEMNYLEVSINARIEDLPSIEKYLAPLM